MHNPLDPKHRDRLSKTLQNHFDQLKWARQSFSSLVKNYAGTHYGTGQHRRKDLTNLMLQTAEAYTIALAANAPRFMGTTDKPELYGFSKHFARALNALVVEIRLEQTLEDIVRDAFFCVGISKTYLANNGQVEVQNDIWMDPGSPFVGRVSLDNMIWDTAASDWRAKSLAADRYRVPFDSLKDPDRFDQVAAKHVSPTSKNDNADDSDLAKRIGQGDDCDADEYEPMVDLADVYLAREKLICTWPVSRNFSLLGSKPLNVIEWDGPEEGPYDALSMGPVPDNIVPTSPAANLRGLHMLANSLFRKQDRQASRQKTVTMYRGGQEADAKRVRDANDGDIIKVDDPDGIRTVVYPGADPQTLAFMMQMFSMFDRMSGNLQSKLGLGPQSPTAAQDKMISEQVSRQEEAMANRVMRFATKVGSGLGNLLFSDTTKTIPGQVDLRLPGYQPINADWTPSRRQGSFRDYKLTVEPYSMAFKSPTQRLSSLFELWDRFTRDPNLLAQAGVQPDLKELLGIAAEMLNEPRVLRIFKFDQMIPQMEQQQGPPAGGNSTRRYIRESVSGGPTQSARNNLLLQTAVAGGVGAGAPVNQQQMASVQ